MVAQVVFHGTQIEGFDLLNAIARNCTCEVSAEGIRVSTCVSHHALTHDQRWNDGLIWMRRDRARLIREEREL